MPDSGYAFDQTGGRRGPNTACVAWLVALVSAAMKIAALLATIAVTTPLPADEPVKADGFTHVRSLGGIAEYRLESNGLRVLLMPKKAAPVVTFMVTYHVGSRNEVTGTTGATHLLEHLMFKGTERFDRSKGTGFDQVLERVGAETNATTWHDRTNYFATVPANALPLLVGIEADRMRNLSLREEDRCPEMTVVRNEFERGENDPRSALDKELWAAAFIAHPYHHDTIGWLSDIEKVPIAKLREFYDTYYWPDNATATVIGDFDPADALGIIRKEYGAIPKSPRPFPEMYTEEPEQTAQRRVVVKRAGELGVVALSHKIPPATHEDWPAVQVLSAILTHGKTSRCYRALTDKNFTTEVSAFCGFNRDPSLHTTYAELAGDAAHGDVEQRLVAEIGRVQKSGVAQGEVQTAVAGLLAKHAFDRDGTFASAEQLNECIAVGDWTLFAMLEEKFKAVTPADVQRVAAAYFVERRSVAGWFVPASGQGDGAPKSAPKSEKFAPKEVKAPRPLDTEPGAPVATDFAKRAIRETVAGVDTIVCPTDAKNVVTIHGSLAAGEGASPNRALAHLAAGMIERGTKKRGRFEIADLLEKAGATLTFKVNSETLEFQARCLTPDMKLVVSLIAEQLRLPAFSGTEFEKLKVQLISEARQMLEDPSNQAQTAFWQAAFPAGHPNRKAPVPELITAIEKAKLADVRDFHAKQYGAASLHIAAAGDVAPSAFKAAIEGAFSGWGKGGVPAAATPPVKPEAREKAVNMADKTSVSVVIGQPTLLRADHPDWLALNVGTAVLGKGFTSRLVGNVRDREGLTYGIGAGLKDDSFRDGAWLVQATFAPALLEKGMASVRREFTAWCKDGISADELAFRKTFLIGSFSVGLETTDGLATQLLRCAERGFDVKWLDEYPRDIGALTVEQVNGAIRKHLDAGRMIVVKAGTLP